MARKLSRAKRKALGITLSPQTGRWIQYKLSLLDLTHDAVAVKAGCTVSMVSHFLRGHKNSDRVKSALAETLGYPSFEALIAASRGKVAV